MEQWVNKQRTGRRGASNSTSDLMIELMVTLSSLFGLAGRQTERFVESIFELMGLDLPVLDYSRVCRRVKKLNIVIPVMPTCEEMHLVVDSTEVKV